MTEQKPDNRRLSLTKSDVQTALGAELLSLCQTVTEDGSLTDEEVSALRTWLQENRSSDLPSIEFLTGTVEQVLKDGKVTNEEREELYKAIELILPPEVRKGAAIRRRVARTEEKERARAERAAQKQLEREERERNRPLASVNFMVAGVRYEGRPQVIQEYVRAEDAVFLVRDRNNKYSRNAVEVRTRHGYHIGFVPEYHAVELSPMLDKGCPHVALVTKVLTGGRAPIPVVDADVFRPDSSEPDVVFEKDVPPRRGFQAERGCLSVIVSAFVLLLVLVAMLSC